MAYRLPPLSSLRAFESAARHLSFKNAAQELHVTPAAVSHQIKALEAYLGVSLFERLPRALALTAHGRAMLPKLREGFECFAAAVESTRQADDGALTVHVPPSFALRWLVPRLPAFSARHPEVSLRVSSAVTNIDGMAGPAEDGLVDMRTAGSEVSIRFGAGNYPGHVVETVLLPDYVLVCSPDLIAKGPPMTCPRDLLAHPLIHDESIPDERMRPNWADWFRLAGAGDVDASRGPRFSSAVLVLEAVLGGQGVALALGPLVAADVAAGRLVLPFPVSLPSRYAYYLLTTEALAGRPSVRAFREWLRAEVAKDPLPVSKSTGDIIAG